MSKHTFSDAFCGVGMNSVAFRQAGLEPVFASDIDPVAREVYEDNLGLAPHGDLALADLRQVPDHDVCVASPPCQPHSVAGEQKGLADERSGTLYSLLRFVAGKRPRAVVIENVAPMATRGNAAFSLLRTTLKGLRYKVSWKVLQASGAGAAQNRERLFVVASLGKRFRFEALESGTPGRILDFLDPRAGEGWLEPQEYELLGTPRVMPSGVVHAGHRHATPRDPGGDTRLPRTHYEYNWIYGSTGLGPTLTTSTNTLFLVEVGGRVRRVTLDECRRLMGLPEGFRLGGRGVAETMRLLGNGVYVPLVRRLADEVVRQLLAGTTPARPGRVRPRHTEAPCEDGQPDAATLKTWGGMWRDASHATRLRMLDQPGVQAAIQRLNAMKEERDV